MILYHFTGEMSIGGEAVMLYNMEKLCYNEDIR